VRFTNAFGFGSLAAVSSHTPDAASGEFLDLLYAVLHSVRRETAVLLRSVGTTPGQLRFLRMLARCDSPRRPGELAEKLDVVPRSVTTKVDQAEADGHVRRIPDPTDRRATLIELTDEGRALLAAVAVQQHEGAAERLAVLAPDERAELLRLLRQVADHT
jgi:DNA-binding MarR family transcriptional regulator